MSEMILSMRNVADKPLQIISAFEISLLPPGHHKKFVNLTYNIVNFWKFHEIWPFERLLTPMIIYMNF